MPHLKQQARFLGYQDISNYHNRKTYNHEKF